jgi:hypothetical protein
MIKMPLVISYDKQVKKISGPVSMYILTPVKNQIFPKLPVFMLFGDRHGQNDNMCEEKLSGVHPIYSIEFLETINTLGSTEEPIDFYVEGGDFHNQIRTKPYSENYPLINTKNIYVQCYRNKRSDRRSIAQYPHSIDCTRIPNIRWQSGDTRLFTKPTQKQENLNDNLWMFLTIIIKNFSKGITEKDIITVIHSFNESPSRTDIFKETLDKGLNGHILNLLEELKIIRGISLEETLPVMYRRIFSADSMVRKQLDKLFPDQQLAMEGFIKQYCINQYNSLVKSYEPYIKDFEIIQNNLVRLVIEYVTEGVLNTECLQILGDKWRLITKYYIFISSTCNMLIELYTVFRSFKYFSTETTTSRPILNIVYYGEQHIQNMIYFLSNISELYSVDEIYKYNPHWFYKITTDKDGVEDLVRVNGINRCIDILKYINLPQVLDNARNM